MTTVVYGFVYGACDSTGSSTRLNGSENTDSFAAWKGEHTYLKAIQPANSSSLIALASLGTTTELRDSTLAAVESSSVRSIRKKQEEYERNFYPIQQFCATAAFIWPMRNIDTVACPEIPSAKDSLAKRWRWVDTIMTTELPASSDTLGHVAAKRNVVLKDVPADEQDHLSQMKNVTEWM